MVIRLTDRQRAARWPWGGIAALVVLLATIVTGVVAHGHIEQVVRTVAAIVSVVGIGAVFRWAVLRERAKSSDQRGDV
jgi:cobalamin biosynthesis protein CobD/CbiB